MTTELRPAATVLLLRDGEAGLEVWLMERNRATTFMGAAWVFPGGRVDPADSERLTDNDPEDGIPRAFRAAAARELEEEAAVRLGLERYDLSALRPWAHWVTPEVEPRRYDTWFFAAALPAGAVARIDGNEATRGGWFRPQDALAAHADGRLPLAPPTLRSLTELLPYTRVADALAAPRALPLICPRFSGLDDAPDEGAPEGREVWVLLPGDPEHPSSESVAPPTRFRFAVGRWWAR